MTNDECVRIGAKFKNDVAESLEKLCDARGESVSAGLRRSVRRELARHSLLDESESQFLSKGEEK